MKKKSRPLRPIIRLIKGKRAINQKQLCELVTVLWKDAIMVYAALRFGDNPQPDLEDVLEYTSHWQMAWRGGLCKTEVYYFIIPYGEQDDEDKVHEAALSFVWKAFDGYDDNAPLAEHDYIMGLHERDGKYELHLLVDRRGTDQILTIRPTGKRGYAEIRDLIANTATENGIPMSENVEPENGITMSYQASREAGIIIREYEKVSRLPEGIGMKAVAAVWGDRQNLRCLFDTDAGDRLQRTVYWNGGYMIEELGVSGKELELDLLYWVIT
jgi:hypothetical protein